MQADGFILRSQTWKIIILRNIFNNELKTPYFLILVIRIKKFNDTNIFFSRCQDITRMFKGTNDQKNNQVCPFPKRKRQVHK